MNNDQRAEAALREAMTYRALRMGAAKELRRLETDAMSIVATHMERGNYDLAAKYLARAKYYGETAGPLEQGETTVRIDGARA
jgi:hypothetical protein